MSSMTETSTDNAHQEPEAEHHLHLRHTRVEDYADIRAIMEQVYPRMGPWELKMIQAQINRFPEGQICIEDNGRVVAAAITVQVDYSRFGDDHSYDEITGNGWLTTHDPNGDVLYGVDVFVDPDYRDLRLGRRLYDARKALCRKLNARAIIAGGRIPGYRKHADSMTPQEYIEAVKRQELHDPILSFQLANDFQVEKLIKGYLPEDEDSLGYATLVEWNNLYYQSDRSGPRQLIGDKKANVRLGAVQWQMRKVSSLDELLQHVEFFVDAVSSYQSDFALFPEFFNMPLLNLVEGESPVESMRRLADFTVPIIEAMSKLAVSYNINIVAGSLPVVENDQLYNVAYVLRRDGTTDAQYKLHITPTEQKYWNMVGGDSLQLFDTDAGKIGVLICYDVEFPELSRLLADEGMQILFVPFWTDTKNGFLRVQRCAQARAIENECYVVISGSCGNLPSIDAAEIQYAQSAVYSPSDFAFPHDAIMAETTPNTEMTLIVDADLDKLQQLHNEGTVRNQRDRRLDLYKISWSGE